MKLIKRILNGFNFPAVLPAADPPAEEPPKTEPPKAEPPKAEPPKAEPPKQEPAKAQELDYEKLAQTMLGAVEKRTDHASKSVIKSMAEQYNLTEDEATTLFEKARDAKKAQLPPEKQEEVNKVLQMANDRLIAAEVKTVAAELKIVDIDIALAMMDKSKIKVNDKSEVIGVKESLEALIKSKPLLVGKASGGAWGDKQGGGAGDETTVRDEAKKRMFGG